MKQDTLTYDSVSQRPLPRWLTDQKAGLTKTQTLSPAPKEDRSLGISFALTIGFVLLLITLLTVIVVRKKQKPYESSETGY